MGIDKIKAAVRKVMPQHWRASENPDGDNTKRIVEGHGERAMRIENVPANVADYLEAVQPSAMLAILKDFDILAHAAAGNAHVAWRNINSAPRDKRVIVVSNRFPEPHEAMLYDDGWHTWGVGGAYRDDPVLWTDLPTSPVNEAQATQSVVVVWDKAGKFFQNWTADYNEGHGIEHGKRIASQIGGTYVVIGGRPVGVSELDKELERFAVDYPKLKVNFNREDHTEAEWECIITTMTMTRGEYGIYEGRGTTKLEALLEARRRPDENKAQAAHDEREKEQRRVEAAARERQLDDQLFSSI